MQTWFPLYPLDRNTEIPDPCRTSRRPRGRSGNSSERRPQDIRPPLTRSITRDSTAARIARNRDPYGPAAVRKSYLTHEQVEFLLEVDAPGKTIEKGGHQPSIDSPFRHELLDDARRFVDVGEDEREIGPASYGLSGWSNEVKGKP